MHSLARCSALAALAVVAFAHRPAFAQSSNDDPKVDGAGPTYSVEFVEDPLNALPGDTLIPRIVVRPGPVRTMLLRPRMSYVTELLKSVEVM
jgi:hypothetical protein